MLIRFTKLNDRRHQLQVERGGRRECVELESRSTLYHDFTHLAVEEAAGIDHGFFGSLAAGMTFAELARQAGEGLDGYGGSALELERAVAVLQRLARVDEDPAVFHARVTRSFAMQKEPLPSWFTVDLVSAVRSRLRALVGRWNATRFGAGMEVSWARETDRP